MFTIGEFSRITRISSRMLRHYDAIGLLRPANINRENGYRYYDSTQVSVLFQIETLKSYGFSLAEVQELLSLSGEEYARRLHTRRIAAYNELQESRKRLRRLENELMRMECGNMNDKYHVILMTIPAQRVFGIRRTINVGQVHDLFQELHAEVEKRGLKRAGATQMLYLGEEFSYENMEVEAQVQVSGQHPDVQEIPEQLCVSTIHIGRNEELHFAYDAICAWMAQNSGYKVCGPGIERYLKDENDVSDPEEMETGILFPVENTIQA